MKKYTIDTAIQRLEEITAVLENGEYDLEASMKLYEEGVKLIAFCNKSLVNAQQKIMELSEEQTGDQYDD